MRNYVAEATADDPLGQYCSFCGLVNKFADDCGWWCIWPEGSDKPGGYCCEDCWVGEYGQAHRDRYGLGER